MRWACVAILVLGAGCDGGHDHVHGDWGEDLPVALEQAREQEKLVLVNFTGSDWCPPCRMLHDQVLSRQEFVDYAEKRLVLVELDFPRQRPQTPKLAKANQELAGRFKVDGFPTLLVLDQTGRELDRREGLHHREPKELLAWLDGFKPAKLPSVAPAKKGDSVKENNGSGNATGK